MRNLFWTGLAVLAMVSVLATNVSAQQGQGRGRGFPGGPGMGMGRTQSALTLSGNAAVQKELGATEDQIAKLKTLSDDVRADLRAEGGNLDFQGLRDLPEEERRAKMAEFNTKQAEAAKKVNEKFKPKLAEILDAKQVERLDQIALQAAGPNAYTDANVVKTLKLTKEQQDKLASITAAAAEKARESFGGGQGGGGGEDRMAKMRELNAARDKELAAVLTEEQASQLAKLKGKEFDVAQLRPAFGPGGGAAGGAGGGQPGGGRRRPQ